MTNKAAMRDYIRHLTQGAQPNSNTGIPGITLCAMAMLLEERLDIYEMVEDFHHKFKRNYSGPARMLDGKELDHRLMTLREEIQEFEDACTLYSIATTDEERMFAMEKAFDALIDLAYFNFGTAHLMGFHRFKEGFKRVHEANMKKELSSEENPGKRSEGGTSFIGIDIVKPKGWTPPVLIDLL